MNFFSAYLMVKFTHCHVKLSHFVFFLVLDWNVVEAVFLIICPLEQILVFLGDSLQLFFQLLLVLLVHRHDFLVARGLSRQLKFGDALSQYLILLFEMHDFKMQCVILFGRLLQFVCDCSQLNTSIGYLVGVWIHRFLLWPIFFFVSYEVEQIAEQRDDLDREDSWKM